MGNVTEQAVELPNNLYKKNVLMSGQELGSQEQLQLKTTECQFQLIGAPTCHCCFLRVGEDASAIRKTTFSMLVRAGLDILCSRVKGVSTI